jgi:hypothetical protein
MFGQVYNDENKFFVSGQEIIGIDSLDISYSNSASIAKYVGFKRGNTITTGPTQSRVSISRSLIFADPLYNYTGNSQIRGSINYQDSSYGFNSGFLEEYMVNCAVGSLPKVTTNIVVYDEFRRNIKDASGSVAPPSVLIPNQGSISLICDNSSTNRVVGFDYSVKCMRKPVYSIGSKFPKEVCLLKPIEFAATVQIDVDDALLQNSMNLFLNKENKTVSFLIKSNDGANTLQSLTIPNASLVAESLSSSADGGVKLTLNYIGHLDL